MRRRTVFQRIQEESEALMRLFVAHPQRAEDLRLHILAMNTNRNRKPSSVPFNTTSYAMRGHAHSEP